MPATPPGSAPEAGVKLKITGETVRLKVLEELCGVGAVWSVTATVKVVVARVVDGVPLICPVLVEKFNPVGKVPPDNA